MINLLKFRCRAIYICDVCNKEDKNKMEFKLKIWKSDGEVTYEMDLCGSCFNKLEKLISKKEEVSGIDLIKDIFHPVYQKIVEKREDLIGKQKKRTHGFEPSWFTPQVVSALKAKGLNPISHGKGVDLTFPDGLKLELKAASDFRLNYLIKEGALRYNAPVLFYAMGQIRIRSIN